MVSAQGAFIPNEAFASPQIAFERVEIQGHDESASLFRRGVDSLGHESFLTYNGRQPGLRQEAIVFPTLPVN